MILSRLTLRNFRSYSNKTFSFTTGINVIVAPNAAGKTNIVEAVFLLATGKSFRADSDKECIRLSQDVGRISATEDDASLELVLTRGEVSGVKTPVKKYLVNGVPRRMVDFVGTLHAVLFWPEHLGLVTDSPSVRRRYLDSVLVQTNREYRRNLISYERALRQRNSLLDRIRDGLASRGQLLFWDQLLIKTGSYITDARAAYVGFVNEYQQRKTAYQLTYDKSVISEVRLGQYAAEEVAAAATLVGPHRDDVHFFLDHVPLESYGSRGQQRMGVLWLKLAELSYFQESTSTRPILLLDDIFSELDDLHKSIVMEAISGRQVVITSADRMQLPDQVRKTGTPIQV